MDMITFFFDFAVENWTSACMMTCFRFSFGFAWKLDICGRDDHFFCSSLDFASKIEHLQIFFSKYVFCFHFFSKLP